MILHTCGLCGSAARPCHAKAVPTAPSVRCTFPVRSRTIIDHGYPLSAVKRRLFRLAHAAAAAALVRAGQAARSSDPGRARPKPCKTPDPIVHNFPSFCKMKIAKDPFFSQKLQIGRRSSCRYVKFSRYFLSRSSDPIVFDRDTAAVIAPAKTTVDISALPC